MMKKLTLILSALALITGLSSVRAETIEHNLLPGKPFEGTTNQYPFGCYSSIRWLDAA